MEFNYCYFIELVILTGFLRLAVCPQSSYVETIIPNVMVFGATSKLFGR